MDYLSSGSKTEIGENVKKMASCINADSSTDTIKQIMYLMNKEIKMKRDDKDPAKFRRTAEEIIENKSRNGCCDSSTLFVSLCRAKGIPAMQVIALDMNAAKNGKYSDGHFFSACFLKESNEWVWLDSDKNIKNMDEVIFHPFDPNMEMIDRRYLIFAKVRDYSEYEIDGLRIDSIPHMNRIHKKVYENFINKETER